MADPTPDPRVAPQPETVFVTGASSDIGRELISQLAPLGPRVLAHFNTSAEKLEGLRLATPGIDLVPLRADLASETDTENLVAAVRRDHGVPDKIVHLAAPALRQHRFKDLSWGIFLQELDVQLRSVTAILLAFLPEMARRQKGKIVIVLSSATLNIPPTALAHYVTAKYALLGLARALAAEYSPKRLNINCVSPSMVDTAFLRNLPTRMVEIVASQSPWRRNATPRDVANVIRFLLSAESDYLTGANIPVSGGTAF